MPGFVRRRSAWFNRCKTITHLATHQYSLDSSGRVWTRKDDSRATGPYFIELSWMPVDVGGHLCLGCPLGRVHVFFLGGHVAARLHASAPDSKFLSTMAAGSFRNFRPRPHENHKDANVPLIPRDTRLRCERNRCWSHAPDAAATRQSGKGRSRHARS